MKNGEGVGHKEGDRNGKWVMDLDIKIVWENGGVSENGVV